MSEVRNLSNRWEELFNKTLNQVIKLQEKIKALENENATLKYRISLYDNSYSRTQKPLRRKLTQKVKRKKLKKRKLT